MLRTLFPAGRWFGVEVRLHISFAVLLTLALLYGAMDGNAMRGIGLWLALLLAVAVREAARALAALYAGYDLRAMFLLPVGGVMAFGPGRDGQMPVATGSMMAAGPVANALCGLLLLGACYALVPGIHLAAQPWISTHYVLRSIIWTQFAIAILGLLPSALSARLLPERKREPSGEEPAPQRRFRFQFNFGAVLSLLAIVLGIALVNPWFLALGGFFFMLSQARGTAQRTFINGEGPSVRVRDVMLTDYSLLSASDTLAGALEISMGSMGETFPVVRGDQLVGAITRSTLLARLTSGGDGYVQGAMTKSFPLAAPEESVADAQRRAVAAGSVEFIPVVEEDALVGILTPESVARAASMIRPAQRMDAGRG